MSDEHQPHVISVASLHATLTQLSVQVGRMDERQKVIQEGIERHMREEHKEFKEALLKVEKVEDSVSELHAAAKTTRLIAAVVAGLVGIWASAKSLITIK
jgi:hypothetical protein